MNCKKCGKKMIPSGYSGYAGKGDATWKEEYYYFCPDCDVETTGWWIFKKTHINHHKIIREVPFGELGKKTKEISRKIIHWLDDDKKYLCNKNLSVVLERTINPSENKSIRMDEIDKITCKNCIKKMIYKYPFVVPHQVCFSGRKVILPGELKR